MGDMHGPEREERYDTGRDPDGDPDATEGYKVGYGKPPRHTRFRLLVNRGQRRGDPNADRHRFIHMRALQLGGERGQQRSH